jgi:antitoxin VapB
MGLTITDEGLAQMIRDLAERKGVTVDEAVRHAVAREVEREAEVARKIALTRRLQAEIAAMPVLDPRSPDELLGYDENGLPT